MTNAFVAEFATTLQDLVIGTAHVETADLQEILTGQPSGRAISRMRGQRALVGLRVARRGYLYPAFQIDLAQHRIEPAVARTNKVLVASVGADAALRWWLTASAESSETPAELARSGRHDTVFELLADLASTMC